MQYLQNYIILQILENIFFTLILNISNPGYLNFESLFQCETIFQEGEAVCA